MSESTEHASLKHIKTGLWNKTLSKFLIKQTRYTKTQLCVATGTGSQCHPKEKASDADASAFFSHRQPCLILLSF